MTFGIDIWRIVAFVFGLIALIKPKWILLARLFRSPGSWNLNKKFIKERDPNIMKTILFSFIRLLGVAFIIITLFFWS